MYWKHVRRVQDTQRWHCDRSRGGVRGWLPGGICSTRVSHTCRGLEGGDSLYLDFVLDIGLPGGKLGLLLLDIEGIFASLSPLLPERG